LPVRLCEADISDDRLEEMADKCTQDGPVEHFTSLDLLDVLEIYWLARKH